MVSVKTQTQCKVNTKALKVPNPQCNACDNMWMICLQTWAHSHITMQGLTKAYFGDGLNHGKVMCRHCHDGGKGWSWEGWSWKGRK